jgi:hypothetical protein
MPRQKRTVALIECDTDVRANHEIASSRGLAAEPAAQPRQFYLLDHGRNMATELEEPLLAAVIAALDDAAERGDIPQWTIIENHLANARNLN